MFVYTFTLAKQGYSIKTALDLEDSLDSDCLLKSVVLVHNTFQCIIGIVELLVDSVFYLKVVVV